MTGPDMTNSPSRPAFRPLDLLRSKWTALLAVLLLIGGIALHFWLPYQRLLWEIQGIEVAGGKLSVSFTRVGPEWLWDNIGDEARWILGRPRVDAIVGKPQFGDQGMKHLAGLVNLEGLVVAELNRLHLSNTRVSNEGLKNLTGLTKPDLLFLKNTQISDDALKHLAGLTELRVLNLHNTQISDDGLKHLAGLTKLKWLNVRNTQVSDEGVAKLRRALPGCNVSR